MKTLGEILRTSRTAQGLSIKEVSKKTKIDPKYIKALEQDKATSLPPATFTKGFIRNYAQVLGKNPKDLVAIYRRDNPAQSPAKKPTTPEFSLKSLFSLHKPTLTFIIIGALVFLAYLSFQYRAILIPPLLEVTQPAPNAVVTSPITIEGKTSPDSLVNIEPDTTLKPDHSGIFVTQLHFAPGEYQLQIKSTNRFSRTNSKTLIFTVISQ